MIRVLWQSAGEHQKVDRSSATQKLYAHVYSISTNRAAVLRSAVCRSRSNSGGCQNGSASVGNTKKKFVQNDSIDEEEQPFRKSGIGVLDNLSIEGSR